MESSHIGGKEHGSTLDTITFCRFYAVDFVSSHFRNMRSPSCKRPRRNCNGNALVTDVVWDLPPPTSLYMMYCFVVEDDTSQHEDSQTNAFLRIIF
jgi:hypothetical protein